MFLHELAIFILGGNVGFLTFGIKNCFWGIFIPENMRKSMNITSEEGQNGIKATLSELLIPKNSQNKRKNIFLW